MLLESKDLAIAFWRYCFASRLGSCCQNRPPILAVPGVPCRRVLISILQKCLQKSAQSNVGGLCRQYAALSGQACAVSLPEATAQQINPFAYSNQPTISMQTAS